MFYLATGVVNKSDSTVTSKGQMLRKKCDCARGLIPSRAPAKIIV